MKTFRVCIFMPSVLLAAGCLTHPPLDGDLHRMDKYRPMTEGIVLPAPELSPVAPVFSVTAETTEPVTGVGAGVKAATSVQGETGTKTGTGMAVEAGGQTAAASDGMGKAQGQRILSRGDRIMISLRGIPVAEEIKNIIDGLGEVTLPYVGQVRVAGLTASDAERLIESTYVERGIYRSINVIVVAEDKVYFVQGEVARQGKFSMSGDVTLLQAITEAGGYTSFANRKSVKIIRGEQVLFFNARDIANGRELDPVIASDDIIVVLRSVF